MLLALSFTAFLMAFDLVKQVLGSQSSKSGPALCQPSPKTSERRQDESQLAHPRSEITSVSVSDLGDPDTLLVGQEHCWCSSHLPRPVHGTPDADVIRDRRHLGGLRWFDRLQGWDAISDVGKLNDQALAHGAQLELV